VKLDVMIAAPDLLSLSDDELQLVHESMPANALWSCVRCCKRLRTAALASGELAVVAALAGDLASVKWAHLRGRPVSHVGAGKLCHIAAARNDLPMLRWTLANGGVGLHGAVVMELAIAAGNLDMVRVAHDHGCVLGRAYETAAVMGHLVIVQWLCQRDSECSKQLRQECMTRAAGCAAAHGHLEVLKWLTGEREEGHHILSRSGVQAGWGPYILSAAARGGYPHIIEWAHRWYPVPTKDLWVHPNLARAAKDAWARDANLARAAAERVQRQLAGQQRVPLVMSLKEQRQMFFEEANKVAVLLSSSALLLP
jgi:hypothetical protein